ncbi:MULTISPECIES: hypothetical protein [unclassified Acinetobacter]|uniref:hypothetical protein n=1 Tax=unclassified Acinetobacter TaxID=196816 RepID=UPI0035B882DA
MFNKFHMVALAGFATFLTACATTQPTSLAIQNQQKQYKVIGMGKDQLTARNNAIRSAQESCPRLSRPILVKENTEYKGIADERTGRLINQAGAVLGVFTGKKVNLAQDTDYQVTLDFECR